MEKNTSTFLPEIWGGVECTINRVDNSYFDQLDYAGHYDREEDIDLFASLGIKAFRFPVLWEKHQPALNTTISFSWAEERIKKLMSHDVNPIVGLLHHGSGPLFTNLADPEFPVLFAGYAHKVALHFPYIKYYTPINEPLTTARFSGLYGHWYPHKKTDGQFARMLINQAKATVLAMEKIRAVNKDAVLIQTEDLGKIYSTSKLKYQAQFENERRWLTFDLLCAKVNKKHRMWRYLKWAGIKEQELKFFIDNPCPPAILGVNHYLTSERFLDHETTNYPRHLIGGNGKHRYADIDAIRVEHGYVFGLELLLKETWQRYKLPISITEVQLNCYREHQLRWFKQAFDICSKLNQQGEAVIKGVTAWALLGAYGWNKLVTQGKGDYETGVFDLRTGKPRATALYHLIRTLANKDQKTFPVVAEPGWWQMENRFIKRKKSDISLLSFAESNRSNPILITGKRGTLGYAFSKLCESRGISYRLLSRDDVDISNKEQIEGVIDKYKPWAIVNAAGFVRVDDAEVEIDQCFRDNAHGPQQLAEVCAGKGIKLMTFSSDLVFNGEKKDPYLESDKVYPLNIYGQSKAKGEQAVLEHCKDALIIRTSAFFGPWDKYNFVYTVLNSLKAQQQTPVVHDVIVSPTYVPDLVHAALDLLIDDEKNIWHISNVGSVTWADLAKDVALRGGYDAKLLQSQPLSSMAFKAPRPTYSVLNSERGIHLPKLENALERYFIEAV